MTAVLPFLFLLPFVSASCGSVRSEAMSGWALVLGSDPEIVVLHAGTAGAPAAEIDARTPNDRSQASADVRAALADVAIAARVEFVFILLALVGAASLTSRPNRDAYVVIQIGLSGLVAFGTIALWLSGSGWSGPDMHHHSGLVAITVVGWLAPLPVTSMLLYPPPGSVSARGSPRRQSVTPDTPV